MNVRRLLTLLLLPLLVLPASAKVTFTGYGDLRYSSFNLGFSGDPASLGTFGVGAGPSVSRGFSANSVGLFASTELNENLQFLMDLTFKQIGNTVGQTTLQYAYLNWKPLPEAAVRAGRVTLPFGYYNENRFYPFQRWNVTPPVFQTGILGLPISDWGLVGQMRFPFQRFTVEASAYVVNGYGAAQGEKQSLRIATLPGGLVLSNSLRAADNNHKSALGGRVQLLDIGGTKTETGVSYYWGDWDASGVEPMYMANAHVHTYFGGFDFLAEALHIGVRGDQGFAASIGSPNWSTDGGFVLASYDRFKCRGKAIVPFAQAEVYRSRPNDGGLAREMLRTVSAGAALRVDEHLTFKAEYFRFRYELPSVATTGGIRFKAEGGLLSAVVTF
jgi:hypothetical protein